MAVTLADLRAEIAACSDPARAEHSKRFFRTGPGEYGEGDVFLGLTVPKVRQLARKHRGLPERLVLSLLRSRFHEERLLALILMVHAFEKGDPEDRARIFGTYLANRGFVNNWDLVDTSAPAIVGGYLLEEGGAKSRPRLLEDLARSTGLWDRRIAMLATFRFIKADIHAPALRIAALLVDDREDLIHKAVGWMLREIGERDAAAEETFLRRHCRAMPRTMLRYAIEKFPEARRKAWLRGAPPD
jgi:3-methyladenine DNA glycosylase AlkD